MTAGTEPDGGDRQDQPVEVLGSTTRPVDMQHPPPDGQMGEHLLEGVVGPLRSPLEPHAREGREAIRFGDDQPAQLHEVRL